MDVLIAVIVIGWIVGFVYFADDPGDYISRRPSPLRPWLWMLIVGWPITLAYLWAKHSIFR